MPKIKVCTGCGFTWDEYLSRGLLGCAMCYSAFAGELKGMLAGFHGTAAHPLPKSGRRPDEAAVQVRKQLQQYRELLQKAVRYEKFEEAIRIKNEISVLEKLDEKPE